MDNSESIDVTTPEDAYVEQGDLASPSLWEDRLLLGFIMLGAFALTAVQIPYSGVHIPRLVLMAIGACLCLLCMKFALTDFLYLMVLVVVYAPFQKVLAGGFGNVLRAFNLTNILAIFLLFGWFSRSIFGREKIFKVRNIDVVIGIFAFYSTLSLVIGYYRFGNAGAHGEHLVFLLKRWLEPMVIYYVFVNNLRDRKSIRVVCIAAMLVIFFAAVIALKEFYLDIGGSGASSSLDKIRIKGIAGQSNQMAAFFCYYAFYFLSFFMFYIRYMFSWSFLVVFVMLFQSTHLTFSRGGMLGFICGTIMTGWFFSKRVFSFIVVPLILMVTLAGMLPQRYVGRFHNMFRGSDSINIDSMSEASNWEPSAEGRIVVWKAGMVMVQENALLGIGFGRFHERISEYHPTGDKVDAHNTYLLLAAEMGLPALFLFLSIILYGFCQAYYVHRYSEIDFFRAVALGYMGGTFALLVVNMFGSRLDSNEITFYYWIFTAIVVRLKELTIEENGRREDYQEALKPPPRTMLG